MKKKVKLWTKLLCFGLIGVVGLATTSALVVSCGNNNQSQQTPPPQKYKNPKPIQPLSIPNKGNVSASQFSDDEIKQFVVDNQKTLFTELPIKITKNHLTIDSKKTNDASGSLVADVSAYLDDTNQSRSKAPIILQLQIIIIGFKEDTTTTSLSHGNLDGVSNIKPSDAMKNINLIQTKIINKIKYPFKTIQPEDISIQISNENDATGSVDVEVTLRNGTYQENGEVQQEKTLNKVILTGFKATTPTSYASNPPELTTANTTIVADIYTEKEIRELVFNHKDNIFNNLPNSFKEENIILENKVANNKEGTISVNVKTNCYYDENGKEQNGQKPLGFGTRVVINGFKTDGLTTSISTSLAFKQQTTFAPSQWNKHQAEIKNEIINQGIVSNLADGLTLVSNDITLNEPQEINDKNGTLKLNVTISSEKAWVDGKKQKVSQMVSLSNLMIVEKPSPQPNPNPMPQPELSMINYVTQFVKNNRNENIGLSLKIDDPNKYVIDFDEEQAKQFIFKHKDQVFKNLPVDFSVNNILIDGYIPLAKEGKVKFFLNINKYHISENEVIDNNSLLEAGRVAFINEVEITGFNNKGTTTKINSDAVIFDKNLPFEPSDWENHQDVIKNEIIKNGIVTDLMPNSSELLPSDISLSPSTNINGFNNEQKWLRLNVSISSKKAWIDCIPSTISKEILFYWNTSSDDNFVIDNTSGNIIKYLGSSKNQKQVNLTIPERINNISVIGISNSIISDNTEYSLKPMFSNISFNSLQFPSTLTNIGTNTFDGAIFENEFKIPSSITGFGKNSFGATFKKGVNASGEQFKNIIDNSGFSNATFYQDFILPNTITKIPKRSFSGTKFLKRFVLPESLTAIDHEAFTNAIFNQFELPNKISRISSFAFENAIFNEQLILPDTLRIIDSDVFKGVTFNKELVLPNSLISIRANAFSNSTFHKQLTLPNNLEDISQSAFEKAIFYKPIELPNSLKTIGESAFSKAAFHEELVLPKCFSLFEISSIFYEAVFYQKLILPESITSLSIHAFFYQELILPKTIKSLEIGGLFFQKQKLVIPESVTSLSIGNPWAKFHQEVVLPKSIKTLTISGTFYQKQKLIIPESITSLIIGSSFFYQDVVIPKSCSNLEVIGSVFYKSINLLNVSNVPEFRWNTFYQDVIFSDRLVSLGDASDTTFYGNFELPYNFNFKNLASDAFRGATFYQDFIMPNGIKTLKPIFAGATFYKQLMLPETLSVLEPGCFWGTTFHQELTLPDTLMEMKDFKIPSKGCLGANFLNGLYASDALLTMAIQILAFQGATFHQEFVIPQVITSIPDNAFQGATFHQKLVLPNQITSVGEYAFMKATFHKKLLLSNNLTYLPNGSFSNAKFYENLELPDAINRVGIGSFENSVFIKNVHLPRNLQILDRDLFRNATFHGELIFPSGITHIYSGAFDSATFHKQLTLPSNLEQIFESAFYRTQFNKGIQILTNYQHIDQYAFLKTVFKKEIIGDQNNLNSMWDKGCFENCSFEF